MTTAEKAEATTLRIFKIDRRKLKIWAELISLLVQRDLKVRYRGSFLGYVWSMMNPLLYMVILTFVFSHVMKFQIENFSLFILCGVLIWNLFQQSLVIGVNSIVANGALLKKVKVPAALFPATSIVSVFVNFLFSLVPFIVLSFALTGKIPLSTLALPIFLIPFLIFIFGLVLALSALNVAFRDIGHVLEPLLTVLFYASPIVYPVSALPDRFHNILYANPILHFLDAFRQILFDGTWPSAQMFFGLCALASASLFLGLLIFQRKRPSFIYDL